METEYFFVCLCINLGRVSVGYVGYWISRRVRVIAEIGPSQEAQEHPVPYFQLIKKIRGVGNSDQKALCLQAPEPLS